MGKTVDQNYIKTLSLIVTLILHTRFQINMVQGHFQINMILIIKQISHQTIIQSTQIQV